MQVDKIILEVEVHVKREKLPRYKLHVRLSDSNYQTLNGDMLHIADDGHLVVWEAGVVAGVFAAGKWSSIVRGDAIPEKEETSK